MSMFSTIWRSSTPRRVDMRFLGTYREQAGMDPGVERLDPPVEDLGEAGEVLYGPRFDALVGKLARGATGGDDFDPEVGQPASEIHQAALVGHAQEGAADAYVAGRRQLGAARLNRHRLSAPREDSRDRGAPGPRRSGAPHEVAAGVRRHAHALRYRRWRQDTKAPAPPVGRLRR